jgi:hypothetical protein
MITSQGGAAAPGSDQAANTMFAGPGSGAVAAPTFRQQVIADLPTGIPNNNLLNVGDNAYYALKLLGTNLKGYVPGNAFPTQSSVQNLINQNIRWGWIYLPLAATLTGVQVVLTITGNYTPSGYNGGALYSVNTATGLLTQVAASTSNPTLWAGAVGYLSIPFSASYAAAAGIYFVALLYGTAGTTTSPQIEVSVIPNAAVGFDFANSMKTSGQTTGTTLPATIASSAIAGQGTCPIAYLY